MIVEKIARVYNAQTGDCVRVLETETDIDELIGISFDKEGFNVYGCSRDGLLVTWTWENGAVLREFVSNTHNDLPISLSSLNFAYIFVTLR